VAADPFVTEGLVPPSSDTYYRDRYWNEAPGVDMYLQRRATGDPFKDWITHLHQWHGGPFRKALVLNCGNGWVEQMMVDRGVVAEAVGVDIGADLLAQAEQAAAGRPIRHYRLDVNAGAFPEGGYDLVVNHAAGHHIAYLDRVFRAVADVLDDDGVLVSWDYVGPHRNQYPGDIWEAAHRVNTTLPEAIRSPMNYPWLPVMLQQDPTEAIHAELVLPVMRRYFSLEYERALGGAIAYVLLTPNPAFLDAPSEETAPWADLILAEDAAFTDADPSRTFFVYAIARPCKAVLTDTAQLTAWTAEEDEREQLAAANGGRYYPPTAIAETLEQSVANTLSLIRPGRAWRVAAASTARAVGRHVPASVRHRLWRVPGVRAMWRRLA
jgi:SAM-dependent methyltransferase